MGYVLNPAVLSMCLTASMHDVETIESSCEICEDEAELTQRLAVLASRHTFSSIAGQPQPACNSRLSLTPVRLCQPFALVVHEAPEGYPPGGLLAR